LDLIVVAAFVMSEETPRLVRRVRRGPNGPPILVVSNPPQPDYVRRVIQAGAQAVLTTLDALDELSQAVNTALRGGMHVSPLAMGSLRVAFIGEDEDAAGGRLGVLSDRECEVFELVGRGLSGKDIAVNLHISVKTVETHKHRIKEKLHLPHATQLVRTAANHVLLSASERKSSAATA